MERIFVIVSNTPFLRNREIKKIANNFPSFEIVTYDMKEVLVTRAIEDLDTLNFFTTGKIVVCDDAFFLGSEKVKTNLEHDLKILENYLNNPSTDNILILTTSKLDERKALIKLLKKCAKVIEPVVDSMKLIDENLENFTMPSDVKKHLIDKVLSSPERVYRELEKLKLYAFDSKKITKEMVDLLVTKEMDDNIFHLIDAILKKDKKEAFQIYLDMILLNEEPTKILILLANRIRLYYQVKVLSKTIYSDDEIGRIIGSHPYPVKLARSVVYDYSEKELLSYLSRLSEIDLKIKTGKTYQNVAFENFILSL